MSDWSGVRRFGHAPQDAPVVVRPSAYALFAGADGRVAVVKTERGYFLPGGGVEPGEAPAEAVAREVSEECGLLVRVGSWTVRAVDLVYSPLEKTHFEKRSFFFDADIEGLGVAASAQNGPHWLAVDVAAQRLAQSSHRWAIMRLRSRQNG